MILSVVVRCAICLSFGWFFIIYNIDFFLLQFVLFTDVDDSCLLAVGRTIDDMAGMIMAEPV